MVSILKIKIKNPCELQKTVIKKGFSQKQLSKEIEVTEGYLSQIIKGRVFISPKVAKRLCDVIDVSFDDTFELIQKESDV